MRQNMIIGIVLVRNEDRYLKRVLCNIKDFCDRIIIADHRSQDRTPDIARRFCDQHPAAAYHGIRHPRESHDLIKGWAAQKVWVFGVDGDELYEPDRLAVLRRDLLAGRYDAQWMLLGNALNCTAIDPVDQTATGYLAPPCRSMTKLYNFNAIDAWAGDCPERLHGGEVSFKPGYDPTMRHDIYKEATWQKSFFRCLHLCFLPRSSLDKCRAGRLAIRRNIADQDAEKGVKKIGARLRRCFGGVEISPIKREKYMRGALVQEDVRSFFPPL